MIWLGATSSPLSSPAIIASAITPEPTVAIVRSVSGVIGASIARDFPPGRPRFAPIRPGLTRLSRGSTARGALSRADGRREDEEPTGRPDVDLGEAGGLEGEPDLVGRPIRLDDGELASVGEASRRPIPGGWLVVGRAGLRVRH